MSTTVQHILRATLVFVGTLGAAVSVSTSAWAHYNTTVCDRDGDTCYRVRCDDDGDDCSRISRDFHSSRYRDWGRWSYPNGYGYYSYDQPDYDYDRGWYGNGYGRDDDDDD